MRRLNFELKIAGINPVLIFLAVTMIFALLAAFTGELLRLSLVGFEVIFPIFTSIGVSEWGRTRADDNYDIIAAQSSSVFRWVLCRFIAVFAEGSMFALISMVLVSALRRDMTVPEMLLLYISPAFFLSTVSVLFGLCISREHISTLFCGMLWLFVLSTRSLLRIRGVKYVYLFIRYAGYAEGSWLVNKAILFAASLFLWCVIYWICKKRGGRKPPQLYRKRVEG